MTSFLKSATKIRPELDSSLFFLRSRQNVGHPNVYAIDLPLATLEKQILQASIPRSQLELPISGDVASWQLQRCLTNSISELSNRSLCPWKKHITLIFTERAKLSPAVVAQSDLTCMTCKA